MLITYQAKLLEKQEIAPDILLLKFEKPQDPHWTYQAGQYMIFHVPTGEAGHPARRLYSIASSPEKDDTLDFIIEIVPNGIGSSFVHTLQIGAEATLQGPAGLFVHKPTDRNVIMLATGTGIAPMYAILKTALEKEPETHFQLFWGMKYKKDLYLTEEFEKLKKKHSHFDYTLCLSREEGLQDSSCITGRVTTGLDILEQNGQDLTTYHFYLCGGKNVVEAMREDLATRGIDPKHIHFERFT